jgi:hypothetical protein
MELNIEFFAKTLGESSIAETFIQASNARHIAIDTILWNNEMGQWLDYWLDPLKCEHVQINDQQSEVCMESTMDDFTALFYALFIALLKFHILILAGNSRLGCKQSKQEHFFFQLFPIMGRSFSFRFSVCLSVSVTCMHMDKIVCKPYTLVVHITYRLVVYLFQAHEFT